MSKVKKIFEIIIAVLQAIFPFLAKKNNDV